MTSQHALRDVTVHLISAAPGSLNVAVSSYVYSLGLLAFVFGT